MKVTRRNDGLSRCQRAPPRRGRTARGDGHGLGDALSVMPASTSGRGARPPQQPDEVRGADQRGHQPGRDLGRGDHRAAEGVGEADQQRAEQGGDRQHPGVPPADQRPGGVRGDQADEADHADRRDRGGGEQRGAAQRDQPGAFQPHAEHARGVVVEREQVQLAAGGDHGRQSAPAARAPPAAPGRRAPVGRAGQPGQRLAGVPRVGGDDDEGDDARCSPAETPMPISTSRSELSPPRQASP